MDPTTPLPDTGLPAPGDVLTPAAIRVLAERSVRRGLTSAFQGLLVSSIQTCAAVAVPVREAEQAALSLAQKTAAASVAQHLDAAAAALDAGLSEQGRHLLPARKRPAEALRALVAPGWLPRLRARAAEFARPADGPLPWDVALATAVDALAEAAAHAETLAAAQPEASSARIAGVAVVGRLATCRATLDALRG